MHNKTGKKDNTSLIYQDRADRQDERDRVMNSLWFSPYKTVELVDITVTLGRVRRHTERQIIMTISLGIRLNKTVVLVDITVTLDRVQVQTEKHNYDHLTGNQAEQDG